MSAHYNLLAERVSHLQGLPDVAYRNDVIEIQMNMAAGLALNPLGPAMAIAKGALLLLGGGVGRAQEAVTRIVAFREWISQSQDTVETLGDLASRWDRLNERVGDLQTRMEEARRRGQANLWTGRAYEGKDQTAQRHIQDITQFRSALEPTPEIFRGASQLTQSIFHRALASLIPTSLTAHTLAHRAPTVNPFAGGIGIRTMQVAGQLETLAAQLSAIQAKRGWGSGEAALATQFRAVRATIEASGQ